jgi:hypothetical protein
MNVCIHTGYITEHASRYSNGAGEALLFFSLLVRTAKGEDAAHKMRVERFDLITAYEAMLTPGRAMTVWSESKLVPIVRHGLVKAETIAFEVQRIEFHSRAAAREGGEGQGTSDKGQTKPQSAESPLERVMREELSGGNMGPAGVADAATGAAGGGASSRTALPAA